MDNENQKTEYKSIWKDEYLATICSFANATGGVLFIGKDDNGNDIGISKEDTKKLLNDLPNKIREALGIIVEIDEKAINENFIVKIKIPKYNVPIAYKGVYYKRSGATNQVVTSNELNQMLLYNGSVHWEDMDCNTMTNKDLNEYAIDLFKKKAIACGRVQENILKESDIEILKKLHLINGETFTNASMLLFSRNPSDWVLGAFIKIGFFSDDAKIEYMDEIHGSILEQVDRAMDIIYLKYMKAEIHYNGQYREEKYFVPKEAMREAIVNAVCHKDYLSGIPIQISVYADKFYVANSGKAYEKISKEFLMTKHTSIPYNPKIANVFYLAGLIESWGSGVEKISNAVRKNNESTFNYKNVDANNIMIEFIKSNNSSEPLNEPLNGSNKNTTHTTQTLDKNTTQTTQTLDGNTTHTTQTLDGNTTHTTQTSAENSTHTLQDKIINIIKKNKEITLEEIAKMVCLTRDGVKYHITKLQKKGLVKHEGKDNKGYWVVKENKI